MARKVPLALALGLVVAGLGLQPASAATSRDLYMVKNVHYADGMYTGEFAALRTKGVKVVGAIGAFYSEYFCISGKVTEGRLRATRYDMFHEPAATFSVRWVGKGSTQRIAGSKSVTRRKLAGYAGTDPKPFLKDCLRST
jgi:hypothetical protein